MPNHYRIFNPCRAVSAHRAAALAFLLCAVVAGAQSSTPADLLSSVNPLVGTGSGPGGTINLFPGPSMPFGMVQLSPDTEDHGFGYHYDDGEIEGFSMTHMSGPGCANEGDVFFTATTGPIVTRAVDFQSPYSHKLETARPGYYEVQLLQWGIKAELSATERTGVARLTFPAGKTANILIPISHTLNDTAGASVRLTGDDRIEGYVEDHGFCDRKPTYKVYFVMTFSRPFSAFGTWTGSQYGGPGQIGQGSRSAAQSGHQEWVGAYARWRPAATTQTITANIGISYVDLAGAENNLKTEVGTKDFSSIRRDAERAWNKELSAITLSGGTAAERTVFYTALYHSLLMPSLFDDADGRYRGFDNRIHRAPPGHHVYTNFSGWDIYRSEIPLLALIEPRRMQDMVESVVLMYQQGGWVPRWPQINMYTNDMVGSPLSIALATAWLDGLHGFDMKDGWQGMFQDATQPAPPGRPYHGETSMNWINKVHFVPNHQTGYGSVSELQEDATAYAALYRLGMDLGRQSEAKLLYDRALYYRNVFDPKDRFFRPREADGTWVPDFNPAAYEDGFVEGSGWQYQTFAPSDLAWLVQATGRDLFNRRMETFFDYPEPGWYTRYYNPYNEPDLQAPYVFHFSGEPWESSRVVRRVLRENYFDAPNGVPGNDDCGAMSSWAVLSMMGIYSVDPTSLAYELVGPMFPKIVIHLSKPYAGTDFVITTTANPDSMPYIRSSTLDGRHYTRNWIGFRSITAGGTMHFTLGLSPDKSWGSASADAPPSLSGTQ